MLSKLKFWPVLLPMVLAAGCAVRSHHFSTHQSSVSSTSGYPWAENEKMRLQYQVRDGCAALETDHVVLLFHGLTPNQQRLFHFQGKQQTVQTAGDGCSTVLVSCSTEKGKVAFRSEYANGTNSLQFGEQTVRFAQNGRLLLVGNQTIDLTEGQKVIHVEQGKAVLE